MTAYESALAAMRVTAQESKRGRWAYVIDAALLAGREDAELSAAVQSPPGRGA